VFHHSFDTPTHLTPLCQNTTPTTLISHGITKHASIKPKKWSIRPCETGFPKTPNFNQKGAARSYDVTRTTLLYRINGGLPQAEANAKKRKLLPTEEAALVDWILDLDQRGFPPQLIDVRGMANVLLAGRGQNPPPEPVGKNWVDRFIANQPTLKTQWNRKFHAQRAKCEDPVIIDAWF
jgi:hypothetical protein